MHKIDIVKLLLIDEYHCSSCIYCSYKVQEQICTLDDSIIYWWDEPCYRLKLKQ
jgi:hypothetical protein